MKARYKELTDRAVDAMLAAIEIYNKPDFQYRSEAFCILAINSWELLLKAKWLYENKNKIRSLYVMDHRVKRSGEKSKQKIPRRSRAGNPITYGIVHLSKKLAEKGYLDPVAKENIEALLELRNDAVHFYHQQNAKLAVKLQGIGAACVQNFVRAIGSWFDKDLSKFNFFLMPLSFIGLPQHANVVALNNEERKFLNYLAQLEGKTSKVNSKYAITIDFDVRLTDSNSSEGTLEFRVSDNPDATEVQFTEEKIREQYPWDYNRLTQACRQRYKDFKSNDVYHRIRKTLSKNKKFAHVRELDPGNPRSAKKEFYHPDILRQLDKHYSHR